jgi:hypothetical protein
MADSDYIIGIEEVNDIKAFFKSLLSFYAPLDVNLTIWGKLPKEVHRSLSAFKARTSLIRRLFFNQTDLYLNTESEKSINGSLNTDSVLEKFTWGIIKGDTPLGHSHAWNDMLVSGSDFIEEAALFQWLEELKSNGIIDSYEKIID